MAIAITPHLNFRGTARDALEFYRSVFGGELAVVTHAQVYGTTDPAEAHLVSWGQVESDAGFRIMAFDVPAATQLDAGTNAFFVSARGTDVAELESYWAKLAEGAEIRVPLAEAAWSPRYGMLVDRFGVTWVLDLAAAGAPA